MVKVRENISGNKYNRLTVIHQVDDKITKDGTHLAMWLCKCDCGKIIIASGTRIKNGNIKSCGCLTKENSLIAHKKYNKYENKNNYMIGYAHNTNKQFIFDIEDYEKIKNFCWSESAHGYVYSKQNGKLIYLSRFLLGNENGIVDHINHNILDNRKSNLRIVSKSENAINHKLLRNNTSGITGVFRNSKGDRWKAGITVNNKPIHLGTFYNFEDAVKARKEAEEKYFGEYSYDNSMKIAEENKV